MYTVTVIEGFIAQHYLTVSDPGLEGRVHSHHYEVELTLSGPELDENNYLVDIDAVEGILAEIRARYGDTLLNDQPHFEAHNPSVERFARVLWEFVSEKLDTAALETLAVTIWEDENASAVYEDSV
ncbi:6-carboxytetrahydropterin synthase [Halococcus sp. IIIV-5B]|uniref:6-pyruvoyl trahydropterin synthase family protein n=1 Tax=Halococcus sp. IIIV-5B TaxID=2321230 RepID=UPI000E771FD4|nr:6-carboxytetrahydropterin synthase [Halococcus sp. IIIV-5B]RJT07141.1 6-carboxytetrahydropterin synthase [Halococcus sp. IIIV-5B]